MALEEKEILRKARNAARQRKYAAANRDKILIRQRGYSVSHKEQIKVWNIANADKRALYAIKFRCANPQSIKASKRKYYLKNAERLKAERIAYREVNREKECEYGRRYCRINKAYFAERTAARRAGLEKATPVWADRTALAIIYAEAAAQKKTVDHVIPLKHKLVCGLHVPWNLQLLSLSENCRKHNKWTS